MDLTEDQIRERRLIEGGLPAIAAELARVQFDAALLASATPPRTEGGDDA